MSRKAGYKGYNGQKLLISGPILEWFNITGVPEWVTDSRELALARARKTLRRKINANAGQWYDFVNKRFYEPLFVTLTFAENVQDMTEANRLYKQFIAAFNYHVFKSKKAVLKYSVVVEFQEREAIHYHALFYNVPFFDLRTMSYLWPHGRSEVTAVREVQNIGAYVTKYMSKGVEDPRLAGKKSYFNSRGLIKPLKVAESEMLFDFLSFTSDTSLILAADLGDNIQYEQHFCPLLRMVNNMGPHPVEIEEVVPKRFQGRLF